MDFKKQPPMLLKAKAARYRPSIILQILIFFLVYFITSFASGFVIAIPMMFRIFSNSDLMASIIHGDISAATESIEAIATDPLLLLVSLFATILTTIGAIIYCRYIEKRPLASMGFVKNGWILSYLKGFAIGTAMLLVCAGIGYISGAFRFVLTKNIAFGYIALFFVGFVIQGMSEEVLLRSYFMVSLSNSCKLPIAIGVSSVVFSLLHLSNPGFAFIPFVNITLFGIFMAVYVLRTENIWGACAIHSAWNFVQGNVAGIQVSGTGNLPSLAVMEPVSGYGLLNGGSFGIEGGLIVTTVLIAAIWLTVSLPKKQSDTEPTL